MCWPPPTPPLSYPIAHPFIHSALALLLILPLGYCNRISDSGTSHTLFLLSWLALPARITVTRFFFV